VSGAIAWLGDPWRAGDDPGRWGAPAALALPLDDRGLLLADGLFETLLVEGGRPWCLAEHRQRWNGAAALLDLPAAPAAERLEALTQAAVARSGAAVGALRWNASRGGGGRGLEAPPTGEPGAGPRFWLTYTPGEPRFTPVRLVLSHLETRNASSQLSGCKSFAYSGSLLARREAQRRGADDAVLASSAGGLSCATAANLLVRQDGRWWTPPRSSGCLPGILRGLALAQGLAQEAPLQASELQGAEAALLINSLGCRPVVSFEGQPLTALDPAEAESLWRALLRGSGGGG
jgi:branched-subunit amino acid aminotransferase/4-amino-4-deoxychorismate lyase